MYVRLAFAVAAHLDPDILIVDEVLAVGDAQFQAKCMGKMEEAGKQGRTILFVSHNMPAISSLCAKAILLEKGMISRMGASADVVVHYNKREDSSRNSVDFSNRPQNSGDDHAILMSGAVKDLADNAITEIEVGKTLKICMHYRILKADHVVLVPDFQFFTTSGNCAFVAINMHAKRLLPGDYVAECHVPGNFLNEGTYHVSLALRSYEPEVISHFIEKSVLSFNVKNSIDGTAARPGYAVVFPGVIRASLPWTVKRHSGISKTIL
ncbi:MAG: Wzt carbohydrate-binding domain-containing protein [Dissulfurispiraceae bacterium]